MRDGEIVTETLGPQQKLVGGCGAAGQQIGEQFTADMIPDDFKQQAVFGSPEQVAEQLKDKVYDVGVDGVILSPVTMGGYVPGGVTAVAEALKPVLAGASWVGNRRWDLRFESGSASTSPDSKRKSQRR